MELSCLDEEAQRDVVDQIDEKAAFPSHTKTIRMRKAFEQEKLNYDLVKAIMNEKNQIKSLNTVFLIFSQAALESITILCYTNHKRTVGIYKRGEAT